jgi:hypothetical protein
MLGKELTQVKWDGKHKILVVSASLEVLTSNLISDHTITAVEFEPGSKLRRIECMTFSGCEDLTSFCVPRSVEFIGWGCFSVAAGNFSALEHLTFEAGSNLRELDQRALEGFSRLKSLCLPASVELIGFRCFLSPPASYVSSLESLTFEAGSRLRKIGAEAFFSCTQLLSICLPASVSEIDGATFQFSHFVRIDIEAGNMNFCVRDHFILDPAQTCIVASFGEDESIDIPDDIETIGPHSFASRACIRSVSFGSRSRVRCIGACAFFGCYFESIHIPSSVQELGQAVFSSGRLRSVTFDPTSQLTRIGPGAFMIHSLTSFCVPSSVEFIGNYCFSGCMDLSKLTFESPSHLRELLSLPTLCPISLDIPDSVLILRAIIETGYQVLVINFGRGSQLKEIHFECYEEEYERFTIVIRAFVGIPARRLKVLRDDGEFESNVCPGMMEAGFNNLAEA